MIMLAAIVIGFCVIALIFFFLFLCLCIGSFLGLLKVITSFLIRIFPAQQDQIYSTQQQPINKQCFICLQNITNEVVATCNHSFCGQCIINYIQTNTNNQINCPACRKQILVLFRRFQPLTDSQAKIKEVISTYNYKYTKQPSLIRAITQFGNTINNIPMLFTVNGLNYVLGDDRLKYLILFAIYTFFPYDFLPEALLGPIGLIDDGVVVAGMIRQISSILYGFVRQQLRRQRLQQ